jgi:DNA-binding NarL/FixJ family response regulator
VVNAYLDGRLVASLKRKAGRQFRSKLHDLSSEEAAVLALLHHGLTRDPYMARAA